MLKWWLQKPMRMIQTNLREIDVDLDVEEYIKSLKEFSANVLLFNVGGIVANYPTKLPFHYTNKYLKEDFVKKVLSRTKQEGIRFIARFDFSKVNEILAEKHPEWLYKNVAGKQINYNGQVHTCVNSIYQQEYCLKILGEVIDTYPIDGVFFNMAGYVTRDYSGIYQGICQCDSCSKKFKDRYGYNLPVKEDIDDPVFRLYDKFRKETCRELFNRISQFIKSKNENIAIALWDYEGVDIFRSESNTSIDRPLPEWNYSASQNVKLVTGSWEHIAASNTAVHFVDIPFRHAAVSPHLAASRLAQNIINGGWVDYYVIGTLNNQDDRLFCKGVKDLFEFHKLNEKYYTNIKSVADMCLIAPVSNTFHGSMKEFKGIYRILTEANVLFDLLHDVVLNTPEAVEKLKKYKVIILPDVRNMSPDVIKILDSFVSEGGKILATGKSSTCDAQGNPLGRIMLKCSGIDSVQRVVQKERGMYLRIEAEDKVSLKGFEDLDIIYLDDDFMVLDTDVNCKEYLAYIPPCMFGPPEKCYYSTPTDIPGMILNEYAKGKCVFVPWNIGKHYESLTNHAHSMLLVSILRDLLQVDQTVTVDTNPFIELASHMDGDGNRQLISMVNHSGQLGTGFFKPLTIFDISVRLKTDKEVKCVTALRDKRRLEFTCDGENKISFMLPKLELLETIVVEFK